MSDDKMVPFPQQALTELDKYRIEVAARDVLMHRMLGLIEHMVTYLTSEDSEPKPPAPDPGVN